MKITGSSLVSEIRGKIGATVFQSGRYGTVAHLTPNQLLNLRGATEDVQNAYQAIRPNRYTSGANLNAMNLSGGSAEGVSDILARTMAWMGGLSAAERAFWMAGVSESTLWKQQAFARSYWSREYQSYFERELYHQPPTWKRYAYIRNSFPPPPSIPKVVLGSLLIAETMKFWIEALPYDRFVVRTGTPVRVEGKFWPVINPLGEVVYRPFYRVAPEPWPANSDEDWFVGYVYIDKKWTAVADLPYYPAQIASPKCPLTGWRGPICFGGLSQGEWDLINYIPGTGSIFDKNPPATQDMKYRIRQIWLRLGFFNRKCRQLAFGPPAPLPVGKAGDF